MRLTKRDIQDLAKDALIDWGLPNVIFKWDNSKRRFGRASYGWEGGRWRSRDTKLVPESLSLSWPLCKAAKNDDSIMDTILHEIAHLLITKRTGRNHGHDWQWKQVCTEVGALPERCYDDKEIDSSKLNYKYTATCSHGCTFNFSRMGKAMKQGRKYCRAHREYLKIKQNY